MRDFSRSHSGSCLNKIACRGSRPIFFTLHELRNATNSENIQIPRCWTTTVTLRSLSRGVSVGEGIRTFLGRELCLITQPKGSEYENTFDCGMDRVGPLYWVTYGSTRHSFIVGQQEDWMLQNSPKRQGRVRLDISLLHRGHKNRICRTRLYGTSTTRPRTRALPHHTTVELSGRRTRKNYSVNALGSRYYGSGFRLVGGLLRRQIPPRGLDTG